LHKTTRVIIHLALPAKSLQAQDFELSGVENRESKIFQLLNPQQLQRLIFLAMAEAEVLL
jgi:hypothetical protein